MIEDFGQPPKLLKLVPNPSVSDKIARSAFLRLLQLKGIREKPPKTLFDKNNENYDTFRIQSYFYEENGEKIYRNIECKESLMDSFDNISTLTELMQNSVKENINKNCLGVRPIINEIISYDDNDKSTTRYSFGEYEWMTYSECKNVIDNLSLLLIQSGFNHENKMALFTDTCPLWLLTAHALFQIKSPVVTIYSTLSNDSIKHALNLTEVKGILVDKRSALRLRNIVKEIPSLRYIFYTNQESIEVIKFSIPFDCLITIKHINPKNLKQNQVSVEDYESIKHFYPSPSDVALIMFTSGSTGCPKGVVITHENVVSAISVTKNEKEFWTGKRYLAYLPQSHILEFIAESVITLYGGSLGFGNPLTLFDNSPMIQTGSKGDMTVLCPTFFATVPLLLDRVKKGVLDKLEHSSSIKRIIFETAYNIKLLYFKAGLSTPFLDDKIFKKLKVLFGGEVNDALIGGASLNVDTEDFFNVCFGRFKLGYGLTETCCAGSLSNLNYWRTGSSGPITKCIELKLIPWEEGGYFPHDPKGSKGEILISGKCVVKGYYKNDEITAESFIKDEKTGKTWFKTGDIGEMLPDGTLKIVDRKKDIAKLKHGEYVSLVFIEQQIVQIKLVDMVCVCPSKDSAFIVALVVPNRQYVKEYLVMKGKIEGNKDIEEAIKSEEIKDCIINEIKKSIKETDKLDKYHTPKEILIVNELWTPDSGLLTPSAKLRRPFIAEKYKDILN